MSKITLLCQVEIPAGSRYKYELTPKKELVLDRVTKLPYPANYGFVSNSLAADYDPLDIFIISSKPLQPGAFVTVEVITGFEGKDSKLSDPKLIGVLEGDMVPGLSIIITEVESFLKNYKTSYRLGKELKLSEIEKLIVDCQANYRLDNKNKRRL